MELILKNDFNGVVLLLLSVCDNVPSVLIKKYITFLINISYIEISICQFIFSFVFPSKQQSRS